MVLEVHIDYDFLIFLVTIFYLQNTAVYDCYFTWSPQYKVFCRDKYLFIQIELSDVRGNYELRKQVVGLERTI